MTVVIRSRTAIGQALAKAMASSGHFKTQTALARRSGVSQTTISRILRGEVAPQSNTLLDISHALKISVAAFFEPTDRAEPRDHDDSPKLKDLLTHIDHCLQDMQIALATARATLQREAS